MDAERERDGLGICTTGIPKKTIFNNAYRYSPSVDISTKKMEILHSLQNWEEESRMSSIDHLFLTGKKLPEKKNPKMD